MTPKQIEEKLRKAIVKLLKKYPRDNDQAKLIKEAIEAIELSMEELAKYVAKHPELPAAKPNHDYSLGVTVDGRDPNSVEVLWIYVTEAGAAFLKALGIEGVEHHDEDE